MHIHIGHRVAVVAAILGLGVLAFAVYAANTVGGMTHHEGRPFTPTSTR